ncbi:MAG: hypothetical protein GXY15_08980 [Candidatus Hydrogenedentes bacterium]|nr:hypothetical protein [Candidatus Hydrogenedentota bacterium]
MIDRITILGGSSVYVPEFVASVIKNNLNVREIVLHGRPGRKLEVVRAFCERIVAKSGFPMKIKAETEVVEAVAGARYVINQVRVGGMKARLRDEMLPPQFNLIGDEQLGPGAIINALRTLPVVLELARTVERTSPGAVFINLGNPMGILVEALSALTKLTVVGVCDTHRTYSQKIAGILGADPAQLTMDYVGLYHLGWIQDVKMGGRSRMAQLLELLESREEEGLDYDLIELFHMIPTRVTGMYFHRADVVRKQQHCTRFRAEVLYEAEQQILRVYEDTHLDMIPELTRQRDASWYSDSIIPLIQGFEGQAPLTTVACVLNNGSIKDLNDESSVEIPVSVNRKGVKAHKVGLLPRFLKGVFWSIKESDRLTIEAHRQRSFDLALQAMAVNPFVDSITRARKYLEKAVSLETINLH